MLPGNKSAEVMRALDGRWVLVAGYGSIGRRHYQNLGRLGVEDVRLLRATSSDRAGRLGTPTGARCYADLRDALQDRPALVIVSNPTSLHVATALDALAAGSAVLLEKPVASETEDAARLLAADRATGGRCCVAYCFRYHPLYRWVIDSVRTGRIGRTTHAHSHQASYLPDWHPWEDYHNSYAARADLGGGVVRTLDHEVDFLQAAVGPVGSVAANCASGGALGIEVEDTADMLLRFAGGAIGHIHLSFARRDPARAAWVVGDEATADLDYHQGRARLQRGREVLDEVRLPDAFDVNLCYLDMLADAVVGLLAEPPRPPVPLSAGVQNLRVSLAALQSSRERRMIDLE